MYVVGIYYSFEAEYPIYIFETYSEAICFIKKDYENEMRIQKEENKNSLCKGIYEGEYAKLYLNNKEFIEWYIGDIKNELKKNLKK